MLRLLLLALVAAADDTKDGENSRKVLGSSVVTSVSVIMDAGNGSKVFTDAVGKPVSKPQIATDVASPIDLLNPDRYEFYTFDDSGDLVKRLMTLEEIHDIIATGDDDGFTLDAFTSNGFMPEKRVNDVVNNVQNVLKEEIKMHKNPEKPQYDTPDVSDSWSMILPAVFGNSGEDIKPEPPITHVTPDTIMVEPTMEKKPPTITNHMTPATPMATKEPPIVIATTEQLSTTEKVMTLQSKVTTRGTTSTTEETPLIHVEITTNSNSTTEKTGGLDSGSSQVIEIKPVNDPELKQNIKPLSKGTKRPLPVRVTTSKPFRRSTTATRPHTISTATTTTTTSTTVPPTTTITTTTTTIIPPTTILKVEEDEEVMAQASTVQFEKIAPPKTTTEAIVTTTETTTTESPSTTEKMIPQTTTLTTTPEPSTTFGSLSTFFMIDNKPVPETTNSDLSTLGTEYITVKTLSAGNGTTQSPNLDQFLLSSTNIYEINSQLSDLQQSTESREDKTTEITTTTEGEKFLIRLTNPTETPSTTTDRTFMDTIEQLISQAVGTPAPPVEAEKEASMIEAMLNNNANKTMPQIVSEAATAASNLMDLKEVPTTTTEPTTTMDDRDLLSESMDSLLSQILQMSTTIEPTEVTTTEISSTTEVPTTTTSEVPHIINITIIRNEPKPAKSDLSLEMEYDDLINEMRKNGTLPSITNQSQEILKTDASSSIQALPNQEPVDTTSTLPPDTTTDLTTESSTITTTTTTTTTTTADLKPTIVITINETKFDEDPNWTLVSTVAPHSEPKHETTTRLPLPTIVDPPAPVDLVPKPLQGFGLEDSTAKLDTDIYQFVQLCNELAFGFWKSVTTGVSSARSVVVSPFAATSLLAMVFLGARGATSGEMNEILKLDDMVTFNPHLIFKNVSESIEVNPDSGVAVSAIIRELYSDRSKGKLLGFYKERVRQFYDGHVEEASFREIGDVIRRRTNLLVKKNTDGKVLEYLKDGSLIPKPPLAGISVSIFQTDCSQGSTEGRDGELHFVVLPSLRQRRLIPIPATVYRSGFLAGYEPSLDATAAALGSKDQTVSTIFIIPGQQGMSAPGDGLARLEKRLVESSFKKGAWSRLLRSLIPRPGLELQIPRFQHRSLINATQSLKRMGLHDLFDSRKADLKGLNGAAHDLHLSDVVQINEFATCGEGRIGEAHHREVYPATADRRSRLLEGQWEVQRAFQDPLYDTSYLALPLAQRPRQARLPEAPRLRFDRPFLYFVRHNPSGLILHMGRFHPRLLP